MTRLLLTVTLAIGAILPAGVQAQTGGAQNPPQTFTLEEALRYAVEHYPTIRAALERVNASTANLEATKAASLPRFDALWQTNRATANNIFGQLLPQSVIPSLSGPVLPSAAAQGVWGSAVGGLLSWEPFDFGLRGAGVHEAEAGMLRARAEQDVTRLAVQNAVGTAFLMVVNAQRAVGAADADVERRDVLARASHVLADSQLRPGAEASRADAELAAARTRAVQMRETLAVAQATFGRTLGTDATFALDATGLVDRAVQDVRLPTPAPQHPLVQSEHAAVDLARTREEVLAKSDKPRIYLQSSVFARGSGANPDGTLDGGADGLSFERANWAAGMQVIFPNLFDFSSLHARRAAAVALTREESAHYDEAVLTVSTERRTAEAVVDAARAVARNTPIQLSAAQQSEAQARARYQAGLASIVEVAEAQNLLAGAEYQDAIARVNVWRALLGQATAQGSLDPFIDLLHASGVR
jgi:outer membrane protein